MTAYNIYSARLQQHILTVSYRLIESGCVIEMAKRDEASDQPTTEENTKLPSDQIRSRNLQGPYYIYFLNVLSSIFLIITELTQRKKKEKITQDTWVLKNQYGECHNLCQSF